MTQRNIEVVVLSDIHLGTFGCHAHELLQYLRSIRPGFLVLNGDIIDIWNFSRRYFPAAHLEVIQEIIKLAAAGTRVIYITGNHDEMLRRYSDLHLGALSVTDKMILEIDGKLCWIFHGDVFDATTKGWAKVLARLGGKGYDLLILINRFVNVLLHMLGKPKMSLSRRVKNGVKKAVSWISNFEQTAAELAIEQKYDVVICGHIHQPQHRVIKTDKGQVTYLNSGDWVENCTALEYNKRCWTIYNHHQDYIPVLPKKITQAPSSARAELIPEGVMLHLYSLATEDGQIIRPA